VSDEQEMVLEAEAVALDELGPAPEAVDVIPEVEAGVDDPGSVAEYEEIAAIEFEAPAPTVELPNLGSGADPDLGLVLDVPVGLVVEIGRARMTIRETLAIGRGSIITLDKLAGEPADLLVNGKLIARGEVVAIDEEFGLRVTDVVSAERRLEAGQS
jgi:flagellar motor switch protein FliN